MVINKILIKNFRNYENYSADFEKSLNFIVGNNGVGKTNILEAISIVSNIKSFRNVKDKDIVRWENNSYYCMMEVCKIGKNNIFEIGFSFEKEKKKKVKINGNKITNFIDYYSQLLCVIFSPDDIGLINEGPEKRRKYIDSVISKIDSKYLKTLKEYKELLLNRNRILKISKESGILSDQIEIWDNMISERAFSIVEKRKEFIERYSKFFNSNYKVLSGNKESPVINYKSEFIDFGIKEILQYYKDFRSRDMFLGYTKNGPHTDDYVLFYDEKKNFVNYASQGQKRTASLSMKVSEKDIIEKETGEQSVILVDDCFVDLDMERRHNLLTLLKSNNQVIITLVNMDLIKGFLINKTNIIKL